MIDTPLTYISALIEAYRAGQANDHVHLGYWDDLVQHDWETAQCAMTKLHLGALALQNGNTVVDIGCGLGGSLRMASDLMAAGHLIGVNIDPRQLEICTEQAIANDNRVSWLLNDACNIQLEDGVSDRILSLEAMFHFSSREAFLAEASRLLCAGGRLVCSDIQFDAPQTKEEHELLDCVQRGYAPWPTPVIKADDVIAMASDHNLILINHRNLSDCVKPTWDYIAPRSHQTITSPVGAMAQLHSADRLRYEFFTFKKTNKS